MGVVVRGCTPRLRDETGHCGETNRERKTEKDIKKAAITFESLN